MTWAIRPAGLYDVFRFKNDAKYYTRFFRNILILGSIVQAGTSLKPGSPFLLAALRLRCPGFVRPVLSILLPPLALPACFLPETLHLKDEAGLSNLMQSLNDLLLSR